MSESHSQSAQSLAVFSVTCVAGLRGSRGVLLWRVAAPPPVDGRAPGEPCLRPGVLCVSAPRTN
eukprot:4794327-Prymnesium_polylepis.1